MGVEGRAQLLKKLRREIAHSVTRPDQRMAIKANDLPLICRSMKPGEIIALWQSIC